MGKAYRKHVKAERSKVKLRKEKAKTILPKGQNLTDTNFKVKKVVIRDQIKVHDSDEQLFRNKNLKELLSRLNHHNFGLKKDAIDGLTHIINITSETKLDEGLSVLFEGIIKLILDESSEIRKSANRLLSLLFKKLPSDRFRIMFHLLNSYLMCGLTHIDRNIREDSLRFLDTCLNNAPKLCANHAPQLIAVCLDLISDKSENSRTLALNLDARKGTKNWRGQVLHRIDILFSTLLSHHKDYAKEESIVQRMKVYYNYCPPLYTKINIDGINVFDAQRESAETNKITLEKLSGGVLPLLCQMFLEICPESDIRNGDNDLSTNLPEEDAHFLQSIINIIDHLWIIYEKDDKSDIKIEELKKKYSQLFLNTFIDGRFPFTVSNKTQKFKENLSKNHSGENNMSCFSQNLGLAKLLILFCDETKWDLVIPYLKTIFRGNIELYEKDAVNFIACIENICRSNYSETHYFLAKMARRTQASKKDNVFSNLCFYLLSGFALDVELDYIHQNPAFEAWLGTLPELLTKKKVTFPQVEVIRRLAPRDITSFSESLDSLIEAILDNIPQIKKTEGDHDEMLRLIVNLMYYVKDWDEEIEMNLRTAISNNYWGDDLTEYVEDILNTKVNKMKSQGV